MWRMDPLEDQLDTSLVTLLHMLTASFLEFAEHYFLRENCSIVRRTNLIICWLCTGTVFLSNKIWRSQRESVTASMSNVKLCFNCKTLFHVYTYTTPLAIVDETVMRANITAMQTLADKVGTALRPHAKTHKSARVAQLQLQAGARGLTVATLREAEYFAHMGVGDLLLVHPPVGTPKKTRLEALAERVPRLTVAIDSLEAALQIPESVELLWEVDTGHHRLGSVPGPPTVEAVKRLVDHVGIERFKGLLTFPGHVYQQPNREGRRAIAHQEIDLLQETANLLRGTSDRSSRTQHWFHTYRWFCVRSAAYD